MNGVGALGLLCALTCALTSCAAPSAPSSTAASANGQRSATVVVVFAPTPPTCSATVTAPAERVDGVAPAKQEQSDLPTQQMLERQAQAWPTAFSVERALVNALAADLKLSEARIVPSQTSDGRFCLRIFGTSPARVAGRLGFQNGDAIIAVGGEPLRDLEHARTLFEGAITKDVVVLQVERRGLLLEFVYRLR